MPKSPRVIALRQQYYADKPNPHHTYYRLLAGKLMAYSGSTVLNIGCGTGQGDLFDWMAHKGSSHLIGLDVDADAAVNPFVDSFTLANETDEWGIPAESVHFATSRSVLEHIQSPAHFFTNLRRILKPGGEFLFITPNIFHPLMLASAVIPTRLKKRLLTTVSRRQEEDIFPTVYRLNNRWVLERKAREFGFVVDDLQVGEWTPTSYMDFSLVTFRLAEGYYNLVTKTGLEKYFGINIIGLLRKT